MPLASRTLTARLHDPGGQAIAGARLIAQLADSDGRPRSHYLPGGAVLSRPSESTSGDDGVVALELVPNAGMVPAGAHYQIRVIAPDGSEFTRLTLEMPDEDAFLGDIGG